MYHFLNCIITPYSWNAEVPWHWVLYLSVFFLPKHKVNCITLYCYCMGKASLKIAGMDHSVFVETKINEEFDNNFILGLNMNKWMLYILHGVILG